MPKHPTTKAMSNIQAIHKLEFASKWCTPEERHEDALTEVLSFLVAVRDRHRHKLTIHDAIARIDGHQKKPIVEVRNFLIARRDGEKSWINVWDAIELIKGVLPKYETENM